MNNSDTRQPPSATQLIRSTIIALITALVLLVTVVMPAEYAIDPTGAGELLGLTQMGAIKEQLGAEANVQKLIQVPSLKTKQGGLSHTISLRLKPGQPAEIKLEMKQGAKVNYSWNANGGKVNYDTHGDPFNAPKGFYHGYGKGNSHPQDSGVLEAAFDGVHGWFWRNRTDKEITITLKTDGDYQFLERVL